MKTEMLAVLERAYRGAAEEQYAHVLWMLLSLHRLGAGVALLLRGNAALYAQRGQRWPALEVAGVAVPAPGYEASVVELLGNGGRVYVVGADLDALGLREADLCTGTRIVDEAEAARLIPAFASTWYL